MPRTILALLAAAMLTSAPSARARDTPPRPAPGAGERPPLAGPRVDDRDGPVSPLPMMSTEQPEPEPAMAPDDADRPPQLRAARLLGHRAATVRLAQRIIPTVVIADSPGAYCEAIASWSRSLRFPVLYDDGTPEAGEHIARFVRAFGPDRVVRYASQTAWPEDRAARELELLRARNRSLELDADPGDVLELERALTDWLGSIDYPPVGAVVTDVDDPAWTAALALSAGRLQPLVPLRLGRPNPSGGMSVARADSVDAQITGALDARGLEYAGLGDLDALTLAAGLPVRVNAGEGDLRALVDRLGRPSSDPGRTGERTGSPDRWAWAGQVFGTEAYGAYSAMCALFLEADSLWGFDSYDDRFGDAFRIGPGAELLTRHMGFSASVHAQPDNTLRHWRAATRLNLDHDLVLVNTHGNAPEFNFTDGRAYAGEVPLLNVPAAVQFVHSFSMQRPDQADTVGPRWLLHGAYAYLGSMHEPYLDSFVPPVVLAARLAEGWALGAAIRQHQHAWWRIVYYGDPLITLGPAGTRVEDALPLEHVTPLEDLMRTALEREDYAGAVRNLALLGRDSDAARLAESILHDKPDAITPELVASATGPLNRDGRHDTLLRLWPRSAPDALATPVLADALWASARVRLTTDAYDETMITLRRNLRPGLEAADAVEIAGHLASREGARAGVAYLRQQSRTLEGDRDASRILARAIRELGG
ncbi:MAG: hypothetical protein ACF8Q5_07045 [Phycisphaerales bacterium JB040]